MVDLKLATLDAEGAKLRYELVERALKLIEAEKLEVLEATDDQIADFVLEWQDLERVDNRDAKLRLHCKIKDDTVLEWVFKNYSFERLYVMFEFSEYCDWLTPKEIIQHFGDLLKLFIAIRGKTPEWYSGKAYHVILQYAYRDLYKRYRVHLIREWLATNWVAASRVFEDNVGALPSFEALQGVEYHHIYTQYRKMVEEKQLKIYRSLNDNATRV